MDATPTPARAAGPGAPFDTPNGQDGSGDVEHPGERQDDAASTEGKDEALDRVIAEGRPRLHRSTADLLATGAVAGIEVGFGVLAR